MLSNHAFVVASVLDDVGPYGVACPIEGHLTRCEPQKIVVLVIVNDSNTVDT